MDRSKRDSNDQRKTSSLQNNQHDHTNFNLKDATENSILQNGQASQRIQQESAGNSMEKSSYFRLNKSQSLQDVSTSPGYRHGSLQKLRSFGTPPCTNMSDIIIEPKKDSSKLFRSKSEVNGDSENVNLLTWLRTRYRKSTNIFSETATDRGSAGTCRSDTVVSNSEENIKKNWVDVDKYVDDFSKVQGNKGACGLLRSLSLSTIEHKNVNVESPSAQKPTINSKSVVDAATEDLIDVLGARRSQRNFEPHISQINIDKAISRGSQSEAEKQTEDTFLDHYSRNYHNKSSGTFEKLLTLTQSSNDVLPPPYRPPKHKNSGSIEKLENCLRSSLTEGESLRKMLKSKVEYHLKETANLHNIIDEKESKIRKQLTEISERDEELVKERSLSKQLDDLNIKLQGQVSKLKEEKTIHERNLKELEERVSASSEELESLRQNKIQLEERNQTLQSQLSELTDDCLSSNGDMSPLDLALEAIKKLECELINCQEKKKKLTDQLACTECEFENLRQKYSDHQKAFTELKQQLENQDSSRGSMEIEMKEMRGLHSKLKNQYSEMKGAFEELCQRNSKFVENHKAMQEDNIEVQQKLQKVTTERDYYQRLSKDQDDALQRIQNSMNKKEVKIEELIHETQNLRTELDRMQTRVTKSESLLCIAESNLLQKQNDLIAKVNIITELERKFEALRCSLTMYNNHY